jgi:hypothetical protein
MSMEPIGMLNGVSWRRSRCARRGVQLSSAGVSRYDILTCRACYDIVTDVVGYDILTRAGCFSGQGDGGRDAGCLGDCSYT